MKLFVGFVILFIALCISCAAGFMSIYGMMALFPVGGFAITGMMMCLETGKLAAAGWLHSNWDNTRVTKIHKGYMVSAVAALMVITALGIYGYLAKGHLESSAPITPIELQIATKQSDIDSTTIDIKSQQTRLTQLDAAVNSMIGNNNAAQGLRYRGKQTAERKQIKDAIDADNVKVAQEIKDLIPLKLKINDVEAKLGPVKYVADLFGLKDTESAVRIIILILMFAFDPLAVCLLLSSTISIGDGLRERTHSPIAEPISTILPDTGIEVPSRIVTVGDETISWPPEIALEEPVKAADGNILTILEEHAQSKQELVLASEAQEEHVAEVIMTDKEKLLDMLERNPELLQNIVDAIKDIPQPSQVKEVDQPVISPVTSWLDS